ncbi:alpha/beta hydrolase [Aeromicrobium endophyticum]|uniref:Alpha/beta hydrolase n=1 Tax=Aeromicrobium endophyticum TaxID=2292704 RepID=A0A371P0L7_9ACTN|nr:alpha/beta hydrolase [Aeromicrobium endophyticum]REK68896.1 alpha/beta hydrolase [Aeromicrobium endophyticum]
MNEQPIDPDVFDLVSGPGPRARAADVSPATMRQEMRETIDAFTRDAEPIDVHEVVDESWPGRGTTIPVRIYRPELPTAVVVYLHGGAWTAGDIDTHDVVARRIGSRTDALVVSVDYRLVPEHPFPAPFDDAWDAVVRASALHAELPFLVAGDSAGGTLAACVALRARDESGPRIDGQILIYPAIDDDLDTPSMLAFREGGHITRDDISHYFTVYLAPAAAHDSPYAMPGRARSLVGLPPAVMVIPGHDLLRSAEEDYSRRLEEAGVPVVVQLDHDLVHGWVDFAPKVAAADRAFDRLTGHITDLLGRIARDRPTETPVVRVEIAN